MQILSILLDFPALLQYGESRNQGSITNRPMVLIDTMKILILMLFSLLAHQSPALAGFDSDIAITNRIILTNRSTLSAWYRDTPRSAWWSPSVEDTQKALAAIQFFLEKPGATNYGAPETIKRILKNSSKYRVQFVGKMRDGKKVIWCNFFRASSKDDAYSTWKELPVFVMDGSYWFWNIEYDPETNQCSKLEINGEA